ncbi:MAG: hypothetical protein HYS33_08675 [Acidobacteria bacterium]|nr:hypothetical protein [Acidobacteriota bacterium]MBI1984155.1 hypothetical protein [Acidobacteriota bacterium]
MHSPRASGVERRTSVCRSAHFWQLVLHSRGSANIFTPAQVVYIAELPAEGLAVYGSAYVPGHMVRPPN